MPEYRVTAPDGQKYNLSVPDGTTEEQIQSYLRQQIPRTQVPPQEEEEEDHSWIYETIGAPVQRGWNQLQTTEAIMGNQLGWRSKEEMAELIAKQQQDIAQIPMSESAQQGLQEIQEAETWGEAAKEIITNPAAVWDITVSSLVSSIPALVGFVGGLTGGTLIAGPVGGVAGAATGAGTGSLAVEYSQSLVDAMNEAGTDTQSEDQVLEFLNNPQKMEVAKKFALNRGVPIALFDALTAGVAGRLFGPTVKAVASTKAFEAASEAGRTAADVARRAALETGVASIPQVERQAARAALRETGKQLPLAPKVAGASTELLAQMVGGGAGEAAAQIRTEGEIKTPGEVLLEAAAEGPVGAIEAAIASRRPRVAPAPRDPSDIPAEPAPLTREAYDAPIRADIDPVAFVQQQAQQFAQDTPVSMTGGIPSTNTEDYNVVPFTGTDDAGVEFSGWRVETSAGIPITPVIDNEARAEGVREAFVGELDASFARQEQAELDLRADEALGTLRADENPDLFQVAKAADTDTVIPFNDLDATHKKKINSWRANNKDEAPRLAAGMVAVEEMSLAGIRDKTIDAYLAGAMGIAQEEASVKSIQQLTAARNIKNDDQAFQDFARRAAGGRSTKNSWRTMGGWQRGRLKERLEELGATLPGEERQSIPVPKRKPFTAPQYNAVVSSARRQGERDRVWKVEKAGKSVPGGSRFFSKARAEAFRSNMKDKKGTRIKPYKIKSPLREGEIQKSDVTEVLGGGIGNTDAILNAAVERGDLVKVRGQQRWRVADYAIREAQPLTPGLKKRLAARLRGAGIASNKVALELVERLEKGDKGDYGKRVMRLALDKIPENATPEQATAILGETLDHEVVHALVELGVLTENDMGLLGRFVSRAKVPDTDMTYLEQAVRQYGEHPDYQKADETGPEETLLVEEATAEAFRDFAAGRLKVVGKPRTLFRRIIDFFRGMSSLSPADAMYFTARFTPIVEGRVAQRGVPQMTVTTGQKDVDLPEEARPRRRAVDPEEVKGSSVGEEEDAGWRKIIHRRTKGGKILGSPTWVKNNADLARMRNLLKKLVKEGERGRFWYEESAREALRIARGDIPTAEKFIGLLAIYSPQNTVYVNTTMAVKAFTQWENGQPISVKTGDQDAKAQAWMDKGTDWGGRKVNSFYTNLMHEIIKGLSPAELDRLAIPADVLDDIKKATVDLWILRAFGYDVDAAGGPPDKGSGKYSFAENEIRRLTGLLNKDLKEGEQRWLPHQTQAAMWSTVKGRWEIPEVKAKTNAQSLKLGWATEDEKTGKVSPPQSYGPARVAHMDLWRRNALAASDEDTALSVSTAKGAFSDMINRIAQIITWEAVPAPALQSPLLEADDPTVIEFTKEAVELLLDDAGVDVLAVKVGVPLGYTERSTGGYDKRVTPNVITGLVPIKPAGTFDNSTALAYARALQYIFKQEAVPIFRADPNIKFAGDYKVVNDKGQTLRAFDTQQEATEELIRRTAQEDARAAKVERAKDNAKEKNKSIPKYAKDYRRTSFSVQGGKYSRGVGFRFNQPLNKRQERSFFTALRRVMGQDAGYTKITPTYFSVVNYRGEDGLPFLMEDDRFIESAHILEREDGERLGIKEWERFGVESEYGPVHDWVADPEGTAILGETSITRQSDFQDWARNRREAFDALVEKYESAERGVEEAQPRRRAVDEKLRSGPRRREFTKQDRKALQRSFSGFHNVTPTDFVPLKMYNGGVTPVVIEGNKYPVILLSGHNEWADSLGKYAGWGQKHAALHLDDIVENTNYNSVDSFVSGILNMYNANRIGGTLKEAGFEVFEHDNYTDNIRGKKLVIRWWYDKWATPGTIVLQPINLSAIFPNNPDLANKSFASLVTAYALPVVKGKYNVRPTQIISPAVSLTAKREANGANANKPILKLSQKEKRKYQINNPEGLDASDRAMLADVMGSTKKERKTLGEYILGMFRYSNSFSRPSRWRWNYVDRWEGVRAVEVALRKKFPDLYANIYADSSAAAMMAMLDRSAGLMQQFMTAGPVMYSRGMFHAINERIVEAAPPELRTILRQELSDLKVRAGYGPNDEVKGLMQILYPLYDLRKYGSFEAWELYAAARRAKRLKDEDREFLMTDEMIQQGLAIADKAQYQDADGNSVIEQVYDDYQKLNNALILMMEDANLISREAGQIWRDNSDYLPFYRELFVDDTREGGVDGQVVYDLPTTDQDEILNATSASTAAGSNNNLFQNMYNVPAPKELKGGKPTFFIMVNGVRDVKVFEKKTGPKILERIDLLKRLNNRPGVPPARVEVKASTQRIQDPLENILRNANAAITASMRNVGMLRAIRDLGRLNMAERLPTGAVQSITRNNIGVRINGETVWFHTSDPLLLDSMQATGDLQIPGMSIMSTPANILRELVTKTPDFMLANMLRDTISAWATSGASVWPVVGTALGFGEALGGGGSAALLRSSGVFGGYDFKNDPKDAKRALQKYMLRGVAGAGSSRDYLTKGWIPSIKSPLAPAMKLWQFADDITVATDMGTRIAVYNAVLRETGNEAQAAYEALEVINFSRKGRSATIRFITAMVPFLNARIQGLDILWRGSPASADGVSSFKVAERKRRFIWRMATLVALSGAYALAHSDDPEEDPHYANATDEKKDMYFIIKPQWLGLNPKTVSVPKIPIAFEVGLFTKTLPERLIRWINGTDDVKEFRQAMQRGVVGTLNMNPVPQFMKPLLEAGLNVRMYDMSAIVPSYSEENAPEQARAGVGETARELARITGISAEKIEHILIAYTGTLGRYALQGVDAISRSIAGYPDAPAMNPTEYPFLQRFLQDELGGGDLQSFYALKEALTLVANSISEDEANMNFEQAAERRRENWPLVSRKARIDYLSERISDLRNQEIKIRADRVMSSEEKRKYIRQIKRLKSDVLTGIQKLSTQINRELRE